MPEDGGELLEEIEVRFARIEQRLDGVEDTLLSLDTRYATAHRCHMNLPPGVPPPYPGPGQPPGSGEDREKTHLDYIEAWFAANHC